MLCIRGFQHDLQGNSVIIACTMQDEKSSGGDGGLLFSWAEHRLTLYLGLLRDHLPRITEGGALASVVEHTMYCGMSLARVGLDFRSLLPPLFEACILSVFSQV